MTNPIRPGRLASLLGNGEARKACRAEGLCAKATAGAARWLGTECSEGQACETGRSTRTKTVSGAHAGTRSRFVEVRASVGAWTRGNARRAKGRREMDAE